MLGRCAVNTSNNLHLLFRRPLEGYTFNPHRPEGLTFTAPEGNLEISVQCGGKPDDFGYGHSNLFITARTSISVSQDHIDFIEALIDERYPKASGRVKSLPYVENGKTLIDLSGRVAKGYSPTWEMMPRSLQDTAGTAYEFLVRMAQRFMGLLRWQLDASGEVYAFNANPRRPIVYWKTTHDSYHLAPLPDQGILIGSSRGGLSWGPSQLSDFVKNWETELASEPLGHQLLREAGQVSKTNERGALLIAFSALEVGVKQHVSRVAPHASWLAMNSPSPPLDRILREYIPILHSSNPKIKHWEKLRGTWKLTAEFVKDRNKLAHRGERGKADIEDYLRLVSDLLYALDYIEGQDWARAFIDLEVQKTLGWQGLIRPLPTHSGEISIEILSPNES
jgi:hypothetical protein